MNVKENNDNLIGNNAHVLGKTCNGMRNNDNAVRNHCGKWIVMVQFKVSACMHMETKMN